MKALSGYAEWFWLMARNIKPVENRKWPLSRYIKRSQLPICLHASKTPAPQDDIAFIKKRLDPEELAEFNAIDWSSLRGCLIGEIVLVGEITSVTDIGTDITHSPWFFGPNGFVVEDGMLYDKPIPCRGQLGFFEVDVK